MRIFLPKKNSPTRLHYHPLEQFSIHPQDPPATIQNKRIQLLSFIPFSHQYYILIDDEFHSYKTSAHFWLVKQTFFLCLHHKDIMIYSENAQAYIKTISDETTSLHEKTNAYAKLLSIAYPLSSAEQKKELTIQAFAHILPHAESFPQSMRKTPL